MKYKTYYIVRAENGLIMSTQMPESTDTILDSRKGQDAARERAVEIIVMNRTTCPTCCKGRSNPYRNYVNGRIEAGCVDNFHSGHLVTPSASADWHNRQSARAARRRATWIS